MPHCTVCEHSVDRWLPHPRIADRSPFTAMLETVGSDLTVYQCPACGCNDRDRHLWMYMRAAGLPELLPGARLLHIAPERHIETLIERCGPSLYVRGDLIPTRANQRKLDIEDLPFDDDSFDLVICNHVLEHVPNPERSLAEFRRCLQPGGVLIAQTPYSPLLKKSFEINAKPSPEFARLYFGQDDHVRLFGDDIGDIFRNAGLAGDLFAHDSVLAGMDPREYGCNGREPFFVFSKPA